MENLLYRIYGDSLAVVMDAKSDRVSLLQREALEQFKETKELNCSSVSSQSNSNDKIDISLLNYWAFKNKIPLSGHFELTSKCNLRCKHCYCIFKDKDTLNRENILRVIDDLADSGVFGLVLTGGEIFTRDDILDILKKFHSRGFLLRLNTNGTLIDESVVKELENFSNIYRFHISLYSAKEEIHDKITGSKGSFKKTLKSIHLLKEAGFNIRINCSLMKSNATSYKEIKSDIADKLDIPVHYDPIIFPKDNSEVDNLKEIFDDDMFEEFNNFIGYEKKDKKAKLCKAGFSFFAISEKGDIYPCLKMKKFYKSSLGNLQESSFQEIWNKKEPIKRVRESLNNKLRNCNICNLTI